MIYRPTSRQAFTLLELLLVLGLIVMIVALTMPALAAPLNNHRLRRGAEQVRAEWAKARANAMEKGRTYIFRYTPGSESFAIEPWMSGDDYLESDQLVSLGMDASGESLATDRSVEPQQRKLPENVSFLASETALDMRAELLAVANPNQAGTVQDTPAIFFYPDGTTSTARLVLSNQQDRYVTLTLRGFTGVVEVSGLQVRSELKF